MSNAAIWSCWSKKASQIFSQFRLGCACALTMLPVSPVRAERKVYSCLHVVSTRGPDLQRHWAPQRKDAELADVKWPRFSSLCKHAESLLMDIGRRKCVCPSSVACSRLMRPSWKTSWKGAGSERPGPPHCHDRGLGAWNTGSAVGCQGGGVVPMTWLKGCVCLCLVWHSCRFSKFNRIACGHIGPALGFYPQLLQLLILSCHVGVFSPFPSVLVSSIRSDPKTWK